MPRLFSKRFPKPKPSKVQTVTLNGFSGGWNSVDDDISMAARFMKVCTNTYRTPSGGQAVRFGTRFFTDIKPAHNSPIVDTFYYNGKMVVVTSRWMGFNC
jgi:hypothetical protein